MATALLERPTTAAVPRYTGGPATAPAAASLPGMGAADTAFRPAAVNARPIAVAAYPADVPRWVTYEGRRRRVVAIWNQPALSPEMTPVTPGARRLQVELSDGRLLTLLHHRGGWFGDGQQ